MTTEPAATRARTQGDKGEPFRPQRNAVFERPRHMHSASAAAARVHACVTPPLFRAAPHLIAAVILASTSQPQIALSTTPSLGVSLKIYSRCMQHGTRT